MKIITQTFYFPAFVRETRELSYVMYPVANIPRGSITVDQNTIHQEQESLHIGQKRDTERLLVEQIMVDRNLVERIFVPNHVSKSNSRSYTLFT